MRYRRGQKVVEAALEKTPGPLGALEALDILQRVVALHIEKRRRKLDFGVKGLMESWLSLIQEARIGIEKIPDGQSLSLELGSLLKAIEQGSLTVLRMDRQPGETWQEADRFTELVGEVLREEDPAQSEETWFEEDADQSEVVRRKAESTERPPFVYVQEGDLMPARHGIPEFRALPRAAAAAAMRLADFRFAEGLELNEL